jgi:hypothetical protein
VHTQNFMSSANARMMVVTEQPHCTVDHSNALDSGDAMEETRILSVQDPWSTLSQFL